MKTADKAAATTLHTAATTLHTAAVASTKE